MLKVVDKVSNDPAIRQKIFWWAVGVGKEAAKLLNTWSENQPEHWHLNLKLLTN